MPFETFSLGEALTTAEQIKSLRRQTAMDKLREQALQGQIAGQSQAQEFAGNQERRAATQFSQEQQVNGTKLLNAAAAEIAQDPSDEVVQRWLPQLTQAGVSFGANPLAVPPEVRKQFATKLYQSTSSALAALAPQKPVEEPTEIRTLKALKSDPELLALHKSLAAAGASSAPANVQEWQYYSRLDPTQKKSYLEMKRAQQTFLPTIAEVPTVVRPGVAGNPTETQPLTTLPAVANAAATVAGAEAGAKTTATANAEAQAGAPRAIDVATDSLAAIRSLREDEGLKYITGLYSKAPIVPGTPQARADSKFQQIQGKAFLQAFESLKGGGQITQIEGEKATQAIARLSRAQKTEDFDSALGELELIVMRGLERARKAGAPAASSSGPKRISSDADYDALPSGAVFIDPNGKERRKP